MVASAFCRPLSGTIRNREIFQGDTYDAVDLGWKMAAVLKHWGSTAMLESYEIERRPVHGAVIAEAVANHAVLGGQLWQKGLEDDTPSGAALRVSPTTGAP
jgi:hypothetical protein